MQIQDFRKEGPESICGSYKQCNSAALCPITNKTKQRTMEGGEFNRAITGQHTTYRVRLFHQVNYNLNFILEE